MPQGTPSRLKRLLDDLDITQVDVCRNIIQSSGRELSKPAMAMICNQNKWPKTTPRESIIEQAETYLRTHCGCSAEQLAGIWEIDEGERFIAGTRRLSRNAHTLRARAYATPFEEEDDDMKELLNDTARRHFRLLRDPFNEEIGDSSDVYWHDEFRFVYDSMMDTVQRGGILAVVAESGAGKSVLRKEMGIAAADDENLHIIRPRTIDKRRLTDNAINRAILRDVAPGVKVKRSNEDIAAQIEEVLITGYQEGRRYGLVIEEAHDLSKGMMKYLKRFSEIEVGHAKPLGIVLVGQPEIRGLLSKATNWDAREFINRCATVELPCLGNVQVGPGEFEDRLKVYIEHKFTRVGGDITRVVDDLDQVVAALREKLIYKDRDTGREVEMTYPLMVNNLMVQVMNKAAHMGQRVTAALIANRRVAA